MLTLLERIRQESCQLCTKWACMFCRQYRHQQRHIWLVDWVEPWPDKYYDKYNKITCSLQWVITNQYLGQIHWILVVMCEQCFFISNRILRLYSKFWIKN